MTDSLRDGTGGEVMTTSAIARIAGVQASAVTNWRHRFDDFPQPVGTAPTGGPLFERGEVELWLRRRGRTATPAREAHQQLWAAADRLRGTATAGSLTGVIAAAAAFVHLARQLGRQQAGYRDAADDVVAYVAGSVPALEAANPEIAGLFAPLVTLPPLDLRLLLDSAAEFRSDADLAAAVDLALERGLRYGDELRTAEAPTDLVMGLAGHARRVFDPAAGTAGFLIRAGEQPVAELYGQEINLDAWRVGVTRLLLRGRVARIAHGDSLWDDAYPELRADLVVCDPPANVRLRPGGPTTGDPRWRLLGSLEMPRNGDFAWLAHVIQHLHPDGHGYVLLPQGTLFREGPEGRYRAELLRQGTIEAVVQLPPPAGAALPGSLWIVRPPRSAPPDVLLIDAQSGAAKGRIPAEAIVATVRRWRADHATFKPEPGFARSVPVLELLSGDASLFPSRWVAEPQLIDAAVVTSDLARAALAVQAGRQRLGQAPPHPTVRPVAQSPERFRVAELIEHGLAKLVRPARLKEDDFADRGTPVWMPGDIRPAGERLESPRFARPSAVNPKSVTEPGDIVITTIGDLRTRVDAEGGHVLGTSLHALRLDREMFDPHAVAPLLTSSSNRVFTGTTIPRVAISELEFPRLTGESAAAFGRALRDLDEEEQAGRAMAKATAELRASLIDGVAAGVVEVEPASGDEGSA